MIDRKYYLPDTPVGDILGTLTPFGHGDEHKDLAEAEAWSRDGSSRLSDFVSSRPFPAGALGYRMTGGPALLDLYRTTVLHCDRDTMNVQTITLSDGTVRLILSHGVILGSYWLRDVPAAEWQAYLAEQAQEAGRSDTPEIKAIRWPTADHRSSWWVVESRPTGYTPRCEFSRAAYGEEDAERCAKAYAERLTRESEEAGR